MRALQNLAFSEYLLNTSTMTFYHVLGSFILADISNMVLVQQDAEHPPPPPKYLVRIHKCSVRLSWVQTCCTHAILLCTCSRTKNLFTCTHTNYLYAQKFAFDTKPM